MQCCWHIYVSLCVLFCQLTNFAVESIREAFHQRTASWKHNVVIKCNFKITVALFNCLVCDLCYPRETLLFSLDCVSWVKNHFSSCDTFLLWNFYDVTVLQLVRSLLLVQRIIPRLHFDFVVMCNVAHLLFHFLNLRVKIIGDGALTFLQLVHEFLSYVLAWNVDCMNSVRECIAFEHWNCVR